MSVSYHAGSYSTEARGDRCAAKGRGDISLKTLREGRVRYSQTAKGLSFDPFLGRNINEDAVKGVGESCKMQLITMDCNSGAVRASPDSICRR